MDFVQLTQFYIDQANYSLPYVLTSLEEYQNSIFISDKVPFKIENISNEYDTTNDIILKDRAGQDIGVLIFAKGKEYTIATITEYQLVAALDNIDNPNEFLNQTIKLSADYVVIDSDYFLDYECNYKQSSPLWGKFNHAYPGVIFSPLTPLSPVSLQAEEYTEFNQKSYFETVVRGITQIYPFERYLKFYHLLEMNFEYDVIKRIKALDVSAEPHKIGKLLEEYDKIEFVRITYLFENYVNNIPPLVNILNLIVGFSAIGENLLFIYARTNNNNPLDDISKFQTLVAQGNFSINSYRAAAGNKKTQVQYDSFIKKFVAYVIYRIRNSIAHSKIGEYSMTDADKRFVMEFGEPLLIEVLKQLFR